MFEVNFDGLVGPTHNYSGLASGNLASHNNARMTSNPREAVLQGLKKMKLLSDLGIPQAFFLPHFRPSVPALMQMGFTGNIEAMLEDVYAYNEYLASAVTSASSMWNANAATVTYNQEEDVTHITPANLISNLHRSFEADFSYKMLSTIFDSSHNFVVHKYLPQQQHFSDEGAANHSTITNSDGSKVLELFVYSNDSLGDGGTGYKLFPRQTLVASESVARMHEVLPSSTMFIRQSKEAVNAGAFHNDVVFVAHKNMLLLHEQAFINTNEVIDKLRKYFDDELYVTVVPKEGLSLDAAVESYLFNSQIVTLPDDKMALIAPIECQENKEAKAVVDNILSSTNPISKAIYVDCRQSMRNGGGPACLRLRVPMSEHSFASLNPNLLINSTNYEKLVTWAHKHYRDRLDIDDLKDPKLYYESSAALEELAAMVGYDSLYEGFLP